MKQRSIRHAVQPHSFFPNPRAAFLNLRAALVAGLAVATVMASTLGARAQTAPETPVPATATPASTATLSNQPAAGKTRKQKEEKTVQSKDTKKEVKRYKKDNPLEGMDAKLPDKVLYDKAQDAIKHGRFDVARLDLQTLLNTYPDSQFQMRAKLAIADSWYKEGGTAALTQAEQEYRDFITFFPNQPEAAEAQMRIGDIYFKEMDKPDRDHSKAVHAEQEYRLMLQQFPESPRVPEAAQRLREVQESLASAEADVAAFYATHLNWPATIARLQTVADTYPLYSHMDDVLVGLGDAYEAQAKFYRSIKLPEDAKARLVSLYENQAADYYRKVVLEHSAAPHVEDAKDRLAAMNLPIPTPTPEQAAASQELENSRGTYTLSNRALVFILHRPDTVQAATKGDPPLEDPKPTYAPAITNKIMDDYKASFTPAAGPARTAVAAAPAGTAPSEAPAPATTIPAAPLAFQDVPTVNAPAGNSSAVGIDTSVPASTGGSGGSGMGIEIVQPGSNAPAPAPAPGTTAGTFPGTAPATEPAADPSNGLVPKAAANSKPLAPIEKAAPAPESINDIAPGAAPAAQTATPGTKAKVDCEKSDESCSNHKKKKGLKKLNPF